MESGEKGRKLNAVKERDDAIMYIALEATTDLTYKQKQFSFYINIRALRTMQIGEQKTKNKTITR